jgi:hypothetical protein
MSVSSIGAAAPPQHHHVQQAKTANNEPAKPSQAETKPAPPAKASPHKVDVKA